MSLPQEGEESDRCNAWGTAGLPRALHILDRYKEQLQAPNEACWGATTTNK